MKKLLALFLALLMLLGGAVAQEQEAEYDLHQALHIAETLEADHSKRVASVKKPADTIWGQGGWTDGEVLWQLFIKKDEDSKEENNEVVLVAYDMTSKTVLKESARLRLNHANDLTYHPGRNQFLVCHNRPNRTWASWNDPETLEIVETFVMPGERKFYCVD